MCVKKFKFIASFSFLFYFDDFVYDAQLFCSLMYALLFLYNAYCYHVILGLTTHSLFISLLCIMYSVF